MLQALKRRFGPLSKEYQRHSELKAKKPWPDGLYRYFQYRLPDAEEFVGEVSFLAFDFETSGVDASQDQILSIGWVPMTVQTIDISSCEEMFIRYSRYVNERSAEIHQLTPPMLAGGVELDQAMDHLFSHLAGKAALVHGSCIERAFIDHYVQRKYGITHFPCLWIDTMQIEKELTFSGKNHAKTSLQLNDLRADYRLPCYTAHSAAIDALATAELFSAQLKSIFRGHVPRLEKLICR